MRAITVGKNEAGQRLDKMLSKYLNLAGKGFLYKMMRKKNIVLNGKLIVRESCGYRLRHGAK